MLSGTGLSDAGLETHHLAALVGAHTPANAAPTVAKAINIGGNSQISGRTAALSVLGRDDKGEAKLLYNWSVTASPAGGTATFGVNRVNAAKNTTAAFSACGTYTLSVQIVDAGGLSTKTTKKIAVTPTLTSVSVSTAAGQLVNPGSSFVVQGTSQSIVARGLDQFGRALSSQPAFTWSVAAAPSGAAAPSLSARGAEATATFSQAGVYGLAIRAKAAGGAVAVGNVSMTVAQAACRVTNVSTAPVSVWGTSQQLATPTFLDQFGRVMAAPPALTWTAASLPLGGSAPSFATGAGVTTVTFGVAGSYVLNACVLNAPSVSFSTTVNVTQTLTSVAISPNVSYVLQGGTQQFTPWALDQFGRSMANQQVFTWSASAGTISNAGVFTASSNVASCTVSAKSGSVTGTATVTILTNSANLQNAALAALVQSLDADGSISRQDMMRILRSTGADGVVDASEFSDLKKVLNQAAALNIPAYVQILAADVVNGNAANATFQGRTLGNLTAGSSAAQLETLVGKWFLGADHPALCNSSLVYTATAGSLFPQTPSHADERQGSLGDCYFISAMGTLADSNPAAVENMFIDNGDGTYTVRFYTGTYGTVFNYSDLSISAGFKNNVGTADYVTVDRMLPATAAGRLAYAGCGAVCANAANALWIPLAEEAYAQWNETGKEGRDGQNAYASIQGGWMATVDAQVLGYNAIDYIMTRTDKQVAIQALAAHKAVTIGTLSWNGTNLGLYASHAYAIVGYNASTDTFTLFNPWGSNHPGPLTWAQLQATCTQLAVADTSGSTPIAGATLRATTLTASFLKCNVAATSETPPSPSAAAGLRSALPAVTAPSPKALELYGNDWALSSRTPRDTAMTHGVFSASLVDAVFADDGFLLASKA